MRTLTCTIVWLALTLSPALAGVEIEMTSTGAEPGEGTSRDVIYAKNGMLRIETKRQGKPDDATILFRDETMWIIEDATRECHRIDKKGMEAISAQMGEAMRQMEAHLAQLPPEQKKMMQQMMREQMPPGMTAAMMGEEPPPRRTEAGATEQVGSYSCKVYTHYTGGDKDWEICAAAVGDLDDGASEAREAFEAMSNFAEQLRETMRQGPISGWLDDPYQAMMEIDGFPVRVRQFAGGQITDETTLKSIARRDLSDDLFNVPKGYKVVDLADQMKQGH